MLGDSMIYEHEDTFREYVETHEREVREAQTFLANRTQLPQLERLTLKLSFLYNRGFIPFPEHAAGKACRLALTKLSNELYSFCGDIKAGSLHGAWHHVRAIMEINAAVFHIFNDGGTTARRASQFVEFDNVEMWKVARRVRAKEAEGTLDETRRPLLIALPSFTEEQVESWLKLYDVKTADKLAKRMHWHTPSIKELMLAMDSDGEQYGAYSAMCQPTHVSPTAYRLIDRGGPTTLGFDGATAAFAVNQTFFRAGYAISQVNDALDASLLEHFADDFKAFGPFKIFIETGKVTV